MTRALARIVGVVVLVLCLAAPAAAGDRPAVRHGDCDGASRWRLVVRALDAGVLGVRFALGGGAAGETWNVFMDHNGRGFFAGSRVSREGGIVVVRRRTVGAPGADTIRATAHNTDSGETCAGRIIVP